MWNLQGFYEILTQSVVFAKAEKRTGLDRTLDKIDNKLPSFKKFMKIKMTILRSSVIGTIIGIFPGAGATIAAFISYDISKRASKEPEWLRHLTPVCV